MCGENCASAEGEVLFQNVPNPESHCHSCRSFRQVPSCQKKPISFRANAPCPCPCRRQHNCFNPRRRSTHPHAPSLRRTAAPQPQPWSTEDINALSSSRPFLFSGKKKNTMPAAMRKVPDLQRLTRFNAWLSISYLASILASIWLQYLASIGHVLMKLAEAFTPTPLLSLLPNHRTIEQSRFHFSFTEYNNSGNGGGAVQVDFSCPMKHLVL
jgi:hypothetical protein